MPNAYSCPKAKPTVTQLIIADGFDGLLILKELAWITSVC